MRLAAHFTLEELVASETATELRIVNAPRPLEVAQLTILARTLMEPVRRRFGPVHVTSGYRCAALNAAVGGADDSDHLWAGAADIVVPGAELLEVARWVRQVRLPYRQVIYERRGDREWVHLSMPRPGESPRREALQSLRAGSWVALP